MIRGLSALAQLWTPLPHGCHADVTLTFYIGAAPSFIRHLDAPLCRADLSRRSFSEGGSPPRRGGGQLWLGRSHKGVKLES
jgi:hypothetical protein